MTADELTLDTCQTLLRGEMSAVESYGQVITKFDPSGVDATLDRMRSAHENNTFELHQFILESGSKPTASSGVWGGFINALEATAVLLGESPALKILQTGESLAISQYENALAHEEVSTSAKTLIRQTLLPALTGHLIELQQRRDRVVGS